MLRYMRAGMLFLSVCYLALGLLLLVVPDASLPWLCLLVSAAVLLTGAVNLLRYFRSQARSFGALCTLAGGAVTTALGIFALIRPRYVQLVLPIIFGLFILVDGLVRLGPAFHFARRRVPRWWLVALLGLLSCAMGLALGLHDRLPLLAGLEPILFSGILLVVEGALNLGCTLYIAMTRKELADADARAAEASSAQDDAPVAQEGAPAPEPDALPAEPPTPPALPPAGEDAPADTQG